MTQSELMASDDYRALLRGICDEPQSDLPRLVLADWLDEHGDGDRAEFVRGEIELAALGGTSCPDGFRVRYDVIGDQCYPSGCGLCKACRLLWDSRRLRSRRDLWHGLNPLPDADGPAAVFGPDFAYTRRGFVERLQVCEATFVRLAPALFAQNPVRTVSISDLYFRPSFRGGDPDGWVACLGAGSYNRAASIPTNSPLHALTGRTFYHPEQDASRVVSDLCVEYGRAVARLWRPESPGIPARENPVG